MKFQQELVKPAYCIHITIASPMHSLKVLEINPQSQAHQKKLHLYKNNP